MPRNILLRLVADVDPARRGLRGAQQDLKELDRTRAEPLVQIRQRAAEAQLRRFNERLDNLSRQEATPRVQIAMGNTARQIERAQRELDQLTTGRHEVKVDVDERSFRRLRSRLSSAGGLALGAGGLYSLVTAYKGITSAAGESEVSQAKLENQLKALNISYTDHADKIDKVIQKTSLLSGLDDEDLQDAFSNIVLVTEDVNKSLELTGLAADFARRKQLDVAKAGEIVAKVAGGNTGILSRYGIKLREGATASEALAVLQRKLSGSAESYGKTQKGATDRVSVAFENLRETIGEKLAPILTRAANGLADFINQMQSGKGAGGRFADTVGNIAKRIGEVVGWFKEHRTVIKIAIGAWVAYRVAARVALVATRLRLLGLFLGLGPKAAAAGTVTGTRFGGRFTRVASKVMRGFGWAFVGLAIADALNLGSAIKTQLDEAFGGRDTPLEDAIKKIRERERKSTLPGGSGLTKPGKGIGALPRARRMAFALPTVSGAALRPLTSGNLAVAGGGFASIVNNDNRVVTNNITTPGGRAPDAEYLARQLDRKLGARGRGS